MSWAGIRKNFMGLPFVPISLLLVQEEIVIANKQISAHFIPLVLALVLSVDNVIEHDRSTLTVCNPISP